MHKKDCSFDTKLQSFYPLRSDGISLRGMTGYALIASSNFFTCILSKKSDFSLFFFISSRICVYISHWQEGHQGGFSHLHSINHKAVYAFANIWILQWCALGQLCFLLLCFCKFMPHCNLTTVKSTVQNCRIVLLFFHDCIDLLYARC